MCAILINFAVANQNAKKIVMKLKNIFMLLALTLGTFAFVACGDDDDAAPPKKASEFNKEVVGTYQGWTQLRSAIIPSATNPGRYANDTITLALADDGSLVATFTDATWGTATIKGVQATKLEGGKGYKLEDADGSFVMNNPRDPENPTQTFACELDDATISADKTQMTAVIETNMPMGHGEMTFTFQTGEMPTE